ncbi:MAG: right-handed parallel beta-helix repeat-containing protein, partial [Verrucomicrobia bacterium]|nr:right-handed parallel beta-helix repeat-containing protein [Verrucomicrobiota bacterium]
MKKGFVVGFFLVVQVHAATVYVDVDSANPISPYSSWATAATTIQDAVDASVDGDIVLVADGTYDAGGAVTPGYALNNRVCITQSITVQSVNGPELTIIQGVAGSNGGNDVDSVRGVFMTNSCSLVGFTVVNGYTSNTGDDYFDQSGGGIWLTGGCVVSNCVLSGNFAARYQYAPGFGGGAFLYYGGTLEDCLFDGNAANYGGGAASWYEGGILRNCTLSNNSAEYDGGGVRLLRGGTLTNCTLNGNVAREGGGAHVVDSGTLDQCILSGNSANTAGGVYLSNGGTLNDCTLIGNAAYESAGGAFLQYGGTMNRCLVTENFSKQAQAGGVYLNNTGPTLNSCRITRNSSPTSYGGGVYCSSGGTLNNCIVDYNSADSCGGVRLHNGSVMNNCVVTKNSANDYSGGIQAYYGDVYVNNSIVWSNTVGSSVIDFYGSNVTIHKQNSCASSGVTHGMDGCITNNPNFVNVAAENFDLLANSPCIDAGSNAYMPAGLDYAGNPRLVNGTVDMGAYETPALTNFSITTSAGANGTITPRNPAVFQGADQLFSIQPIVGYRVETLVVDGTPVSPSTSYSFTNVQDSQTISATFGVNASTLYVDASRPDDSGDGASWATAKKTIQAAVDEVAAGGTVLVTNGVYATGKTVTPEHATWNRVCITRAITVQSASGPEVTVIEGHRAMALGQDPDNGFGFDSVRGVYMQNGCSLIGFTVRNGFTQENNYDEVDNWGGGLFVMDNCTISNCVLIGNSAKEKGGGAYLYSGGTLEDCTLSENYADDSGGGIYLRQGGTLNHCSLIDNVSGGDGGGGSLDNGGSLNNCLLSGNSARGGGGLHYGTANGCAFTGNSATDGGGMQYGTANNCTFTFNSAGDYGGGFAWGTAKNCILWYNTAGDSGDNLDDMDSPTLYSCSPDLVHGSNGNITNAPLLVSASHIATNSPCVGAGSASYASGTDIDGEVWQSPPAMGCDEITGSITGTIQLSISGPESVCENHATTYSIEVQGAITETVLDFGDGQSATNVMLSVDHAWSTPGTYSLTLTGYNDEFPGGVSTSLVVQVYSADFSAVHVSPMGNDANDGSSWATAKKTIQAGVDAQEITGGIVWVTNGTYLLSSEIEVAKEVRVVSVNGPESTLVDGGGVVRCFNLGDSKCLVSGFTITNGSVNGSTPDGGWETEGGGVNCSGLNPVVHNCILIDNSAKSYGGGMMRGTAKNCVFSNNSVTDNYGYGGGMYQGAAENCLLVGNTANYYGGGAMYTSLRNCTVVNNTVTGGSAGGIGNSPAYNCIVWGNTATGSGNNVYGSSSYGAENICSPDGITHGVDGCITNNPLFRDGAAGNFQLLETSPCVNAGNNLHAPDGTDLVGSPRIVAGTVDMGAYEYFELTSFVISTTSGANGSVSPIDPEVIQGEDQSFAIHPAYGYRIESLTVDGSPVAITTNYTFTNVQSAHTFDALFTADVVYVDASQPGDSGDGLSWVTAKQTLQAAVDAVGHGGTVLATNGTYAVGGTITPGYALNNRVCITRPIAVQSVNGPEVTLIQGAAGSNGGNDVDSVRGVFMENGCSLSGFTVTNGYSMGSGDFAMDRSGGGIWISSGCVVSNCVLTGNAATYGGGVYLRSGGVLGNCLLTHNSASNDGSGAYLWQGGTLNNCTLSLNFGSNYGGGAYLYYGGTLNNCIAWGNTAGYANDLIKIATGPVLRNTCASTGIDPGDVGCITDDPIFVDAGNGNFQLAASSPCINSGDNLYAEGSTDLAGNPRINDGTVDMGAFENQLVRFLITTTAGTNGLISPESPWVYQGGNQTFAIQPEFGYYIDSLEVDGSPVAIATNYTFSNIQASHTLAATFATDPHTLTVESGTGDGSYTIGIEVAITADAPLAGYGFYEWTVEPSEYMDQLTNRYTATSLFTMPESNVTVTANYGLLETYADASRSDDSGDGTSWGTAKKTIQAAVDAVGPNGTVWVADGAYNTGGSVTPGYSLLNRVCITRGIAVRSVSGADVTYISGAEAVRCVFMESGTTLSGFTVVQGETLKFTGPEDPYFDRCGGGIFLQSGCEVSSCRLISNTADYTGGGAHLHHGGTLNNCAIIDNYADYGGGIKVN